eukprot:TRINITY_DN4154_c0_g3_i1.p1 TRINITY_DN4154_c0_g3~~TRINITY_DN4154_c0_g3_i1.p1  ORF type:complete len:431 (-),score=52.18 TRINITY_DN4154_c0_g3_i1:161-1414(-)
MSGKMGKDAVSRRMFWTVIYVCALCLILFAEPAAAHLGIDHGDDGEDNPHVAETPSPAASAEKNPLRSSKILGNKGGALVVFFLVPFITCLIPFVIRMGEKVLVYGMLFGVGLFFTLAVEHLIGDAADGFRYLKPGSSYPTAYCLVALGYMLTFLMDIIVHAIVQRSWASSSTHEEPMVVRPTVQDKNTQYLSNGRKEVAEQPLKCCRKGPVQVGDVEAGAMACTGCNCPGNPCICGRITPIVSDSPMLSHTHLPDLKNLAFAEVLLLAIALCFHAIFEGLVIGLSGTVKEVWNTTITIVIHKIFEGLALGMSLMMECPTRSFLSLAIYALGFAISGPVGISIGMILDRTTPSRTTIWANAIGNAFAAGVFIFVALNHLLVKGMKPSAKDTWLTPFTKWLAVALGFVTTSLIQLKHD